MKTTGEERKTVLNGLEKAHGLIRRKVEKIDDPIMREIALNIDDAIGFLRNQEPVYPLIEKQMDDICSCIENMYKCGKCATMWGRFIPNFCPYCGQEAKK